MTMRHVRADKLILGIGNVLLGDEGIGVRVVEYLQQRPVPTGVDVVDGGTAGADLIDVLADREAIVIVDAVKSHRAAGTIVRLMPEDLLPDERSPLSLHEVDIPETLAMTKMLGCACERVTILGVVPHCVEPGMALSTRLSAVVPDVAAAALGELA